MPPPHFPRRIAQRELERLAAIRANVRDWEAELVRALAGGADVEAGEFVLDLKALRISVRPASARHHARRNGLPPEGFLRAG